MIHQNHFLFAHWVFIWLPKFIFSCHENSLPLCTQNFEFVDDRKSGKKSREDEPKSGMTLFATQTIQVKNFSNDPILA